MDDQEVFRSVIRAVVEATPGMAVVGEASCGEDALSVVDELAPNLAIIDVRMPGMGGVELARALLSLGRPPKVLLVSAQAPPMSLPLAANGRAVVFLAKERLSPAALLEVWEDRAPGAPLPEGA